MAGASAHRLSLHRMQLLDVADGAAVLGGVFQPVCARVGHSGDGRLHPQTAR